MGIRFHCPNGHKINVKSFLAGKRALCPTCGAKVVVPLAADTDAPLAASLIGEIDAQRGASQPLSAGVATVAPAIPLATKPLTAEEMSPIAQRTFSPAANPTPTAAVAATPAHAPSQQGPPPAPPGFRDPIAEAPQAVWYVRPRAGGQYGPAAGEVFRQWVTENRVTPDSYVWRDGWPDWRLASEALPQLAPVDPYRGMAAPAYVAAPSGPAYVAAEAAMAPMAVAVAEVEAAPMAAKRPVRIRKTPTSSVLAVGLLALVAVILIAVLVIVVMNQPH